MAAPLLPGPGLLPPQSLNRQLYYLESSENHPALSWKPDWVEMRKCVQKSWTRWAVLADGVPPLAAARELRAFILYSMDSNEAGFLCAAEQADKIADDSRGLCRGAVSVIWEEEALLVTGHW